MLENHQIEIYNNIQAYCTKYNIPIDHIVEILENQKVLPMIRGKATEYIAAAVLKQHLDNKRWHVQKLNLNAQPNQTDEDISITCSRTGYRLKVEVKNAVRGSFTVGTQRTIIKKPHFKIKCHKSRSTISKHKTTNDRYMLDDFDLLICNVSNALFRGGTLNDTLELIDDEKAISILQAYYNAISQESIIRASYDDWRFCFAYTIVQDDNSIPRTPSVHLVNDPRWLSIEKLSPMLVHYLELVRSKTQ